MLKLRSLFKGSRLPLFTFSLSCLTLISITAWSSRATQDEKQRPSREEVIQQRRESVLNHLKVGNKTRGLVITKIDKEPHFMLVTLRNDYSKPITAYRVSVGRGVIGSELYTSEAETGFLRPGGERQERYPYQLGIEEFGISVVAVIFEDRTTDGDPQYVRELKEQRFGRKIQREHEVKLIQRALKSPKTHLPDALSNLEAEASALSDEELRNLPPNVEVGARAERNSFLRRIQSIRHFHTEAVTLNLAQRQSDSAMRIWNDLEALAEKYAITISKL